MTGFYFAEINFVSVNHQPMPPPVAPPFVEHVRERLATQGPCHVQRLFGGWGLAIDGMNIGIIVRDTLYLKTNAATGPAFVQAGGGVPLEYAAGGCTTTQPHPKHWNRRRR
jgi:TfoX/Sxy family transcriptional regulator of competence genes